MRRLGLVFVMVQPAEVMRSELAREKGREKPHGGGGTQRGAGGAAIQRGGWEIGESPGGQREEGAQGGWIFLSYRGLEVVPGVGQSIQMHCGSCAEKGETRWPLKSLASLLL